MDAALRNEDVVLPASTPWISSAFSWTPPRAPLCPCPCITLCTFPRALLQVVLQLQWLHPRQRTPSFVGYSGNIKVQLCAEALQCRCPFGGAGPPPDSCGAPCADTIASSQSLDAEAAKLLARVKALTS